MSFAKPVLLCILDGWGISPETQNNGILKAHYWAKMQEIYPHTVLQASEEFVGLPAQQMGNSEVGHMTLGLGRVLWQDLPRIDHAIATQELGVHARVLGLAETLKNNGKACHMLGLISPGGVHSHQNHIIYCANLLAKQGIPVWIHGFLDGRDTPPSSARNYVAECQEDFHPLVRFATLGGRYFGMDRDQRWDRVEKAYDAIVDAKAEFFPLGTDGIDYFYNKGLTDEFIPPFCLQGFSGITDGDGLWMINFRSDRVRQILHSLLDPNFSNFHPQRRVDFSKCLGMTSYSKDLDVWMPCLFDKMPTTNSLGEVVSKANLGQLRIAETEKYAHVTFFFNGGQEFPFPLEDRILVQSPKVSTYDLKPEMSAKELTDQVLAAMAEKKHALIVLNYANTDMVGHTGVITAIEKAVETVDECLHQLEKQAKEMGWVVLITADHGNAEQMLDGHAPHTAHTCNPVPFMVVNGGNIVLKNGGTLANVAPTVLQFLKIPKPVEMTEEPLCDIIS